MRRTALKLTLMATIVGIFADVALAGVLPSPFAFSFFTSGLNSIFLWPFALAGCG